MRRSILHNRKTSSFTISDIRSADRLRVPIQPTEQGETNSPMHFFSMLNLIHDQLSREASSSFAARGWRGVLRQDDWDDAEMRLLSHFPVLVSSDGRSVSVRITASGYKASDICLHLDGRLLRVCGIQQQGTLPASPAMFSEVVHLSVECESADIWVRSHVIVIRLRIHKEQNPEIRSLPQQSSDSRWNTIRLARAIAV